MTAMDQPPQHFATGDNVPSQPNAFDAQAKGAQDAFQQQWQSAMTGKGSFLDQATRALGGEGITDTPPTTKVADTGKPQDKATSDVAAMLGLTTDAGGGAKEAGTRVAEQRRMDAVGGMAMDNIWAKLNDSKSHAGMAVMSSNNTESSALKFNGQPMNNSGRPLTFLS